MNRRLKIFLLGCTQLSLLGVFFMETSNTLFQIGVIIGVVLISYYYSKSVDVDNNFKFNVLEVMYLMIGAVSTFVLNNYLEMGPVLAASMIGLIASFIPDIFKKNQNAKSLPIIIYCGAFVGMSSSMLFNNIGMLILASLISGVVFQLTKGVLSGHGGKAGTIAFSGVLLTSLILVACS